MDGDSLDPTGAVRCENRRLAWRVPQVQVVMETVLIPQLKLVNSIVLWLLTLGVGRKLRRFRSCCLMASGNRSWHRSTDHGGNPHGVQPVPGQVAAYRRDELLVGFFGALHTGAGSGVVSTGTRPP